MSRPLSRPAVACGLLAAAVLVCASARAQVDAAQQLLARVQAAASRVSYQGTLVNSVAGTASSLRIVQICEGGQRVERSEALDGQPRQQFRHGDRVHTFWPQARLVTVERDSASTYLEGLPAIGEQLLRHYVVSVLPPKRVAGHMAEGLLMQPRDAYRFAQRLWIERTSGLLMRAEVLGSQGRVLESTGFTDVAFGANASVQSLLASMRRMDGYRVRQPSEQEASLEADGWSLAREVAGFRRLACVRRSLDAEEPAARSTSVLQAVYGDGLTHVSLFIEPLDPVRHQPMRTAVGATHTLMQRHGSAWLTVMGDVPMPTLEMFATALERRR